MPLVRMPQLPTRLWSDAWSRGESLYDSSDGCPDAPTGRDKGASATLMGSLRIRLHTFTFAYHPSLTSTCDVTHGQ